ncbi:DDE-domain-containing protein [Amniculicola lignicola CBS 123094]|uniref:DDE-domain-containing protein n=1 Tax=Amniculicola lignicola CBS 123094 TaxID=1392246 RepID=A0A6A5WWY4_9PLEO|nr:DDE-domain-containing protein [Amniculicola lignicola CBS 123094]
MRKYRGARVKRTTIIAVECISGDGSSQFKPRVLIYDGFSSHETLEIIEYCLENNIKPCRLPPHTSHKLQPCDVAVFAPLKAVYRDEVERLDRGGVNAIGKEHFTSLYSRARNRVLRSMPKPPPAPNLISANEVEVVPHPQDSIQSPLTPVTLVTTQGLASLQNIIINQADHSLDARRKCSLQKNVEKLSKAAHLVFSKGILQRDQIRFPMKTNDEAKVRQSTRVDILGEAKVMGFNELEEARAKRAEKDATKAEIKVKCRRKRKGTAKGRIC